MIQYWPWWFGGIALTVTAVGYHLYFGSTFGFSGIWERVLFKSETEDLADARAFIASRLAASGEAGTGNRDPQNWLGYVGFASGVLVGGAMAALWFNRMSFEWNISGVHSKLFGEGFGAAIVLLIGGLLVGFGTRMAGGCTSGHGLNGCSQGEPVSMLATVIYLGSSIAVTYLLNGLVLSG